MAENILEQDERPRFFAVAGRSNLGFEPAPPRHGLAVRTYAFCFMTQFGRYAAITKKQLDSYRIVQDNHFSPGGASGGTGRTGEAQPIETHVHLDTAEDDEFARTLVDMGEQTCFLHALCGTPLRPTLTVAGWRQQDRHRPARY